MERADRKSRPRCTCYSFMCKSRQMPVSSYRDCGTQEEHSTESRDRAMQFVQTICVDAIAGQAEKEHNWSTCGRRETAAVHTARDDRQRQFILRATRIWMERATMYSASDQGEEVAPICLTT